MDRVIRIYLQAKGFCQAHGQRWSDVSAPDLFSSLSVQGGAGAGVPKEAADFYC